MTDENGIPSGFLRVEADLVGRQIGDCQVLALLGAGGMGEVYRARDLKLGRDVALKVLPSAFASDPDRVARFAREARVLASLNHPHIGALYDFNSSGTPALVLELVEGETLAAHLKKGPLAPDQAVRVARQVAMALDAAHERGVVHRDLKPANIKITPDGTAKVLDFGLAKLAQPPAPDDGAGVPPSDASANTRDGAILGTPAYMSPEQARGQTVDKRTDIWAFGCVLYEMLSGHQAFPGSTVADTVAAVLHQEPDWTLIPGETSTTVRRLLRRCLCRDTKRRLRDIGDAIADLDLDEHTTSPIPAPASSRSPIRLRLAAAMAATIAGAAVAAWVASRPGPAPLRPVTRFAFELPEGQRFTNMGRQVIAVSPDGRQVAYVANLRMYLKSMDAIAAVEVAGSESKGGLTNPVFSPDGRYIAYWAHAGGPEETGVLKKIPASGGGSIVLCEATTPFGITWDESGILYSERGSGIMRVSPDGGTPRVVLRLERDEIAHRPQMLPEGRAILYTLAGKSIGPTWDEAQIVVHALDTGERTVIIPRGSDARYLSSGHLVYASGGTVFAVSFDPGQGRTSGPSVPMLQDVARSASAITGASQFSVSDDGALAYLVGSLDGDSGGQSPPRTPRFLLWVDRNGQQERLPAGSGSYLYPRISPDGTRLALDVWEANRSIWSFDFARPNLVKVVVDPRLPNVKHPTWTPDGRHIVFASDGVGAQELFRIAADGTGEPEPLRIENRQATNDIDPLAFTPDGTRLIVREIDPQTGFDLHLLTLDPGSASWRTRPLLRTPFSENNAVLSPDGRWIAYESDESGQYEIYLRPFPEVENGKTQASIGGGTRPLWSRSGAELFYVRPGKDASVPQVSLMAVPMNAGKPVGSPAEIVAGRYLAPFQVRSGTTGRTYDVSPDARRFLWITDDTRQPAMMVVLNWTEELNQKVPRAR